MSNYISSTFVLLEQLDNFFWSYVGFAIIVILGVFFSIKTKFFQLRAFYHTRQVFKESIQAQGNKGIHPIKLFFSSVGGMIGIGNIVAVITAISIGGPGALVWLWLAGFVGMIIKYSEVYLGVTHRVENKDGYDGGPMYFLQNCAHSSWAKKVLVTLFCLLLCIYGVEVFQFLVITDAISTTFNINKTLVMLLLLGLSLYGGFGGIRRLSNICSIFSPILMTVYILMCTWVLITHAHLLPYTFKLIFTSAFSGHAPIGGFAGSSMLLTAQHGIARAVYSGDIGIGFDSILQSSTSYKEPYKQARIAIWSMLFDMLFCTMSIMIVLVTGVWSRNILPSEYVPTALGFSFSGVTYFMALLLFVAGWTTIIGYLTVGLKACKFMFPKIGLWVYFIYAIIAFVIFTFYDQRTALLVMSLSGGGLLLLNTFAIWKLRREIVYRVK